MQTYLYLFLAIVFEVAGTSMLPLTAGFSRPSTTAVCLVCYSLSFTLLAQVTQVLPTSVVYAIWSSLGIVLTCLVGVLLLGQRLDAGALLGLGLILLGVLVLRLYSHSLTA